MIPFNQTFVTGHEIEYIMLLAHELSVPRALLTTCGTHALEMTAPLLDIKPTRRGDRSLFYLCFGCECVRASRSRHHVR